MWTITMATTAREPLSGIQAVGHPFGANRGGCVSLADLCWRACFRRAVYAAADEIWPPSTRLL